MPEGTTDTDEDALPDEQHPEEDEPDGCPAVDDVLRARTESL